MTVDFERDDSGIRVHQRGVIAQLCSLFRSHEQGLPEWFKNASAAYARLDSPTDSRLLTLLLGTDPTGERYVALLDHGGMLVEDLEQKFANWGDPEAYLASDAVEEPIEGGHGNGGKCYMTQMFEKCSYLHTAKGGRASRYGFVGDDPHPGYFPNRRTGRGFPIAKSSDELKRALGDLGVDFTKLPEEVRTAATVSEGFTLVAGVGAKHLAEGSAYRQLVESVMFHHQMALTTERNRIFVVIDGRSPPEYSPVALPEIDSHEMAPEPKVVEIPEELPDPVTSEMCPTAPGGAALGRLIVRTSKVSMRWGLKGRHHIRYLVNERPVAFLRMENISRSTWVDRMYGECHLGSLAQYETPDRSSLAESPLTRALEKWVKDRVLEYEAYFKKRESFKASEEELNRLRTLNETLDEWKNKFLEDTMFGAGPGEGRGSRRSRPRPLPEVEATTVSVTSPFSKAGVGVWLRLQVAFRDARGNKVAQPPYQWHSDDWAVATVDENRIVTHTPGSVAVWVETIDGRLRSVPVRLEVLDAMSCRVEPKRIELRAGEIGSLDAILTDRNGEEHTDVYMTWAQDDSSVLSVSARGRVFGQKQGETSVFALDERCTNSSEPAIVNVTPAEALPGGGAGRAFPKILLSEADPDPLHPDGETVRLAPEDGPVHQPTPQHVEHNIWWINLACPLAKYYFDRFGSESREWRSYHVERVIETLVKIRLSHDFQLAEEDLTFDEIERRWREIAADVQHRAFQDLRGLLDGDEASAK